MNSLCPNDETLRHFNDGRITDLKEIDCIADHLGVCEKCVGHLDLMAPSPIVQGLRDTVTSMPAPELSNDEEAAELDSMSESLLSAVAQIEALVPRKQKDPLQFGEYRYQVFVSIGSGKFGTVFAAGTDDSHEIIALKIPFADQLASSRHRDQFFADCKLARSLEHPNILPTIDSDMWDDKRVFLAMPLVESPTLKALAKTSPGMSTFEMFSLFSQIVDAIQYAHNVGVFHRHLSPENIFLIEPGEPGDAGSQVVVADFGFCFDSRYQFDLIEPSESKSPFEAPESQTRDASFVDARTDVYSLGKILKLLLRIAQPPGVFVASHLDEIVSKATASRRRKRYQSVAELKSAMDLIEQS